MTTKPSDAPWADEPFQLIPIPSSRPGASSHFSVYIASEMAHAHNAMLRGLNAIMQQAPHVPAAPEPGYMAKDVRDLLFYVASWVKAVEHHHHTEETCLFPDLEEFSGRPGLMQGPKHQHDAFTPGLERLLAYAEATGPEDYQWNGAGGMKEIIDGFAEAMTKHLYEEIDVFLSLSDLDSKGLKEIMDKTEKVAKSNGKISLLYDIFPCILGSCDTTYEGGNTFPALPWILRYAIKYWFGTRNAGAWRFSPCDLWGKPVPLHFRPENKVA